VKIWWIGLPIFLVGALYLPSPLSYNTRSPLNGLARTLNEGFPFFNFSIESEIEIDLILIWFKNK
jgi:hypothetical protein